MNDIPYSHLPPGVEQSDLDYADDEEEGSEDVYEQDEYDVQGDR